VNQLIALCVVLLCGCATVSAPGAQVAKPVDAPLTEESVAHLLNRAAFGPSPEDVARVHALGLGGWLHEQLQPGTDPAITHRLSGFKTLGLTVAQAMEQYPSRKKQLEALGLDPAQVKNSDDEVMQARVKQLFRDEQDTLPREILIEATQARLIRAIQSRRQLEEVLVDFWFNHFNVSAEKNRTRWMVSAYERDAIRPFVLGRFRDLLGATAKHPAMLWYLDNWQSVRDGFAPPPRARVANKPDKVPRGLNENYARELLELYILGVEAGYTQADVTEAARALTGWGLEIRPKTGGFGAFAFHLPAHDVGEKQVFGLTLPSGGGQADGERLLDYLARHPATAHHLARQLCQRFVSDDPPAALVERVAQVFLSTDGDLRATTEAVLTSPEFWASTGTKTRTPLEFVAAAVRAVGALDEVMPALVQPLERLGMPLYRCAPPTGYSDTAGPWVSAGALVTRINFGLALAGGRIRGVKVSLPTDASLDAVSRQVLGHAPSASTRAVIERALAARAERSGDEQPVAPDATFIAGLLLGSPDFQKQ
jgi:uncharacterized protein (DUF1800 family)